MPARRRASARVSTTFGSAFASTLGLPADLGGCRQLKHCIGGLQVLRMLQGGMGSRRCHENGESSSAPE